MAMPPGAAPAGYAVCSFPNNRNGIFYAGEETPVITLSVAVACTYTVRDYFGNVVSSGAASGTSVTPTAPAGGWSPGWYRFYLDGTVSDPNYGTSLGVTNFIVIRDDSRFPPRPALGYGTGGGSGHGGGEAQNEVTKGLLAVGFSRRQIGDASNPDTGVDSIHLAQTISPYAQEFWSNPTHTAYADPNRPARNLFMQFPNRTYDRVDLGPNAFCRVYCKDATVDGSKVFIQCGPGSSSGNKIQVFFPDSVTLVETYDNLANGTAAQTAINGVSAYIKVFNSGSSLVTAGPTAIGTAYGAGVTTAVAALYPYGFTRFEGPVNEPNLQNQGPEIAHTMMLFQAHVHAGNAAAIAMGPCPVDLNTNAWEAFLAAGGAAYCDELSFHAYNSVTNGNLAQGRYIIEAFQAKLAAHSVSLPMWCTESTNVYTSVFAVHHPRRARVILMNLLLWEQYGLPRERNLVWYDGSHGFNSFPAWVINADQSVSPYAALCRVLAEETFGHPYLSRVSFNNQTAEAIFLGSVYGLGGANDSVMVLMSTSHIDNATVTLSVSGGASSLVVIDGFGNASLVPVSNGRAVIPVDDIPTYVRLPAGVSATVHHVLDWTPNQAESISTDATTHTVGGTDAPVIADGGFLTNYGAGTGIYISPNTVPEDAVILFPTLRNIGGIVAFCGASWQNSSALIDFDIDVTTDGGTTWTTVKTVTKATPSSFQHGSDSSNTETTYETFWDEQWVFPVRFDSPHRANGVRLHVRATSYGGEPDATTQAVGQGANAQRIALQEVAVLPASITYTYQWTRDGADIVGATSSTYTTVSGDAGHSIGCKVTATDDGGSGGPQASSNTIAIPGAATRVPPHRLRVGIGSYI